MFSRMQALLTDLTLCFERGDFAGVIAHYDFPLPLELEDRKLLMTRPSEMEALLRDVLAKRRRARFASTRAEIMALELPRRARFRTWVRYHHMDAAGSVIDHSDRIFHCRDRGRRLLIEALDVTCMPHADTAGWVTMRRISA